MIDIKDIANMVSGALQNILETEVEKAKTEGVSEYFNDNINIIDDQKNAVIGQKSDLTA